MPIKSRNFFNSSINPFDFDFAKSKKIIVVVTEITTSFLKDFLAIFDENSYLDVLFSTNVKDYVAYDSAYQTTALENRAKYSNRLLVTAVHKNLNSSENFSFNFSKYFQHMYICDEVTYSQTNMDVFGILRTTFPPGVGDADLIIYVNKHCSDIGYPIDIVHKNKVVVPSTVNLSQHVNYCMMLKTDPSYRIHELAFNFFEHEK